MAKGLFFARVPRTPWKYVRRNDRKRGSPLPVELRVNVVHDPEDKPINTWAFVRDISERKAAERQIQRTQILLRTVIDNTPASIFVKDRDGKYTLANQQMARSHGTTIEEIDGHYDREFAQAWITSEEEYTKFSGGGKGDIGFGLSIVHCRRGIHFSQR